MKMEKLRVLRAGLFVFVLAGIAFISQGKVSQAKISLSKSTVTFSSPTAKSQTITIKGVKKSKVKNIRVDNSWEEWVTIKAKGKNKLVITPKRSGKLTYSLGVTVEYKSPVNGSYSDYVGFKKIIIKGSSKIYIKTAEDLCKMRAGTYTEHKWEYYLDADIDMTGKGMVKYPGEYGSDTYTDIYLDGQGHTIKSDTPIFDSISGVFKNIVFDVNINCTVSKNDANTQIWTDVHYNGYGGLAPVVYNNGKMINCRSTGSITVNMDKDVPSKLSDGSPSKVTEANIAGLVEENCNGDAYIIQCRSDVDITVNFSQGVTPFTYVGGIVALNYGYTGNKQYAHIEECMYTGKLQVNKPDSFVWAGGITGNNNAYISDCLNTGSVKVDSGSFPYGAGIDGMGGGMAVERVLTIGDVNYAMKGDSVSESNLASGDYDEYKDAFYLKSKSDGFNYLGNPFAIPGVTGITDEELKNQATFINFDFEKVWTMGDNGPTLKNVPA
ncbi:MAG: hypothetical protein J5819_01695 [Eubacterium sp.]|nr:hypothetical protein [Eubacterium sp.]